jgi:hypothetical protein
LPKKLISIKGTLFKKARILIKMKSMTGTITKYMTELTTARVICIALSTPFSSMKLFILEMEKRISNTTTAIMSMLCGF